MLKARLRAIMAGDDATVSFVDQALISVGGFACGIVAARGLGPLDFGLFVIVMMILLEATAIQNALTLQPMIVNGASLSEQAFARYFSAQVVIQAVSVSVSASIVVGVALAWEPLRPVALPLMLASAAWQLQEFCRRALYTRGQFVAATINNVVSYDLRAVVLIALAFGDTMSVDLVVWVVAGTSGLGALLGFWQLRRYVIHERDAVIPTARESFRLGRWIAGSYGLSVASMGAYPAFLTALSGLTSTAGYGVVNQVLGPLNLMSRPIESFYLPRAARALHQQGAAAMQEVLWSAARFCAPIFLVYVAALLVGGGWIIGLVFGEAYVEHADALRVFALSELLWFPITVLRLELAARRLQRYLLWVEVWSVVVIYGVGLLLINSSGLLGAALAHLIVNGGGLIFTIVVVRRARRRASSAFAGAHGSGEAARPS